MRIFTSILAAAAMTTAVSAQTPVIDSIQTGGSYGNSVYYSLANGKVKETPAGDWQLGFSIGSFNVSVIANTATNAMVMPEGFCTVYQKSGDTSAWNNFDTSGYASWAVLNNSASDWQEGALNQNPTSQFDYGWGAYNSTTHVITGHRLYLVAVQSGSGVVFKKVWVVNKTMGTWNIRFANIDGTDEKNIGIASTAFSTKNFVYVSLITGAIVDREPAKGEWDFVLGRYDALLTQPSTMYYLSVGILTNQGVSSSRVKGKEETTTTLADTVPFTDNIQNIGYDWKKLVGVTFQPVDSLSFFVKDQQNDFWKLVFTSFASGSSPSGTGKAIFNKTKISTSTGLVKTGSEVKGFAVYPNPATDNVNVLFDVEHANSTITISDLSGRTLFTQHVTGTGFQNQSIDLGAFAKGLYFISVTNGSSRSVQKVIVQ